MSGTPSTYGFIFYGDIPSTFDSSIINGFNLFSDSSGTFPKHAHVVMFLYNNVNDDFEENFNSIVNAINDQTSEISSALNDQTDQITGTIEDQYSGSPESSFNTGDIITQHNEKMGVLSFGSDVMLQFLDMFQSANVGAAQLTLPGFNITVQDVNYQVWEDQTFNFSQLEQWVPGLIDVIRIMLPAFVWLMVLRYCIQVFERNFLSK